MIEQTTQAILSPYADSILAAKQWQRRSNDCGPCTTATVINALCRLNLDGIELAVEMNRPAWRGLLPVVRRIPNWATFPWGMVDVMRQYHLNARWRIFTNSNYLAEGLSQGKVLMPIIGGYRPPCAHVMALIAWDEVKGWGFANTQQSAHEASWLDGSTFQKQWKAMANLLVEIETGGFRCSS